MNVNGLPETANGPKQDQLGSWLRKARVDVALLAEINLFWPAVHECNKWFDRSREISPRGHYSAVAYNKFGGLCANSKVHQYGGCISSLFNRAAHGASESGVDPTGLGRFAWTRIKGRNLEDTGEIEAGEVMQARSKDLILVSAYRPTPSMDGDNTVWIQQRQFYAAQGKDVDPREAFMTDLLELVVLWRTKGYEVVVGVDANEDLQFNGPMSFRHRMRAVGLEEAILNRHKVGAPATCNKRTSNVPIDGIFISPGVVMQQGGYLGFSENITSDHRCLWVDIQLKETLGGHTPQKSRNSPRRLNMKDGKAVARYIAIAEQEYLRLKIPHRLAEIAQQFNSQEGELSSRQVRQFNFIHKQSYDVRRMAEKYCRKLHHGGVPWSPALQEIRDRIQLWKMLITASKGRPISSRKLRRLLGKTAQPDAWRLSLPDLEEKLRMDISLYKKAKRSPVAHKWRSQFLLKRREWARKRRHRSLQAFSQFERLQRMRQREETRRRKKAQGKCSSGGLRAIQIEHTQPNGSIRLVTLSDPNQVAEGCMQENQARYDQTRAPFSTPPMQEPLYSMFTGSNAHGNVADLVSGALPDQPVDQYTQQFLRQCRVPDSLPLQDMAISVEDHMDFWSKMKEEKGSEPHGLHNGHYKAGVKSDLLVQCDTIIRDIPMRAGISPELWQHLMNFSIEKQPGKFRLSKMRTIQLMNSELQANNKKVGKAAMKYAEKHSLIPPGQCGSRKAHESIALVISKRLNWDLLRIQRRAAGWISNDAKSCFDRIVHWIGMVALYRFGIPWPTLLMMFGTLQLATHRVRTGFGDYPNPFLPPSDIPFQGCGQGNGAGPTIWVAVSAILIGAMQAAGFGFECLSAVTGALIIADCFCFVDDSDVVEAAKSVNVSGEEIFRSVQNAMNLWAGLVRATGGALNPPKCFWWLIDFKWDSAAGVWRFRKINDFKWNQTCSNWQRSRPSEWIGSLLTWNLDGSWVPIRQLQPSEVEKTLGVMMSPEDNGEGEFNYLVEKTSKWAETVRSGRLRMYDVLPLIRTTIMKTIEYPMALTFFSCSQWMEIMKPVLLTCLPKAGVCRNFKRLAVFAPLRYQGLGLPHPVVSQLCAHLMFVLKHLARQSQSTPYLKAVMEGHRLETGTSFDILQQVFQNTGILATTSWIKNLWEELDGYDIHVETDTWGFELLRERDCLLMELFMDNSVPQEELRWLNWCRLYLHVVTLSDIVTADGKESIELDAWNGRRLNYRSDRYQWPRTCRPAEHHWHTWKKWLQKSVLKSGSMSRALQRPLGDWLDDINDWKWVFSAREGALFHRQGHVWIECICTSSSPRSTSRTFALPPVEPPPTNDGSSFSRFRQVLPPDAARASVSIRSPASVHGSSSVILTGIGAEARVVGARCAPSLISAWKEAKQLISGDYGWVPEKIHIQGDERYLFECLLNGSLRMVSDGSFKNKLGSAAIQLRPKRRGHVIWIWCQTPGKKDDQSAYRSELIGLLAGIMVATWLLKEWSSSSPSVDDACSVETNKHPKVQVACDGISALRNSFVYEDLSPSQPQFDLVASIRKAAQESKIEWIPRHVKGHADQHKKWHQLDWWEKRNVEVDKKATQYRDKLESMGKTDPRNPRFFSEPCALFIQGCKVSSLCRSQLEDVVLLPQLIEWWDERERITPAGVEQVDWDVTGRAMKALPAGIQRWCSKHVSGMCAVGKVRVRRGLDKHNRCPLCSKPEDHRHVPRCGDDRAQAHWDVQFDSFVRSLHSNGTAPEIIEALTSLLQMVRDPEVIWRAHWRQGLLLDPRAVQNAYDSQLVIGPQGMLEGLLSTQWASLQQSYFSARGSRRSGRKWATQVSKELIMIGFQMWEHRNEVFHSDQSVANKELSAQADQEIQSQVEMGPANLSRHARHQLTLPLRRLLAKPLDQRIQWIRWIKAERILAENATKGRRRMMFSLRREMLNEGKKKRKSMGLRVRRVFSKIKRKEIKRKQAHISQFLRQQ